MTTTDARDKAVEEARAAFGWDEIEPEDRETLNLLWQRAQEARDLEWWAELIGVDSVPPTPDAAKKLWMGFVQTAQEAEREECAKIVCYLCRGEMKYWDPVPTPKNGEWWHALREHGPRAHAPTMCYASGIRNRAARASEEGGKAQGVTDAEDEVGR